MLKKFLILAVLFGCSPEMDTSSTSIEATPSPPISTETKEEPLVELADGRLLPRTHPDVTAAIQQRREEREELRNRLDAEIVCEHDTHWCEHAENFLDNYRFNWKEVEWDVVISPDTPDAWVGGLANSATRTIYVFPADDWTTRQFERVLAHELGHAVDHRWLTEEDRTWYRITRDIPKETPQWAGGWPHDHSAVGEDFAELFAVWSTHGPSKSPWKQESNFSQYMHLLWPPGCDTCTPEPSGAQR